MILDSHLITGIRGMLNRGESRRGPMVMVLGIRPDIIRASIIINLLRKELGKSFILIWSGQHYSDNLKDIFFRELEVEEPDIELGISGTSDADLVSSMISNLSKTLENLKPEVVIFLGDTNTVTGTLAAGQLNIPIVHIEGCMRSYDWRMPEEKYRTIADHMSDLIYCYLESYRNQGMAEGIPGDNIIVTGNPIVDVLEKYYINSSNRIREEALIKLLNNKYNIQTREFFVMTCHRRENVETETSLRNILDLAGKLPHPVIFPASYRTQSKLNSWNISIPVNVSMVDPIGYMELLDLLVNSLGVLTDSGTVVEEAAILGVPTIQMRKSTERPEVYEFGSAIKFDPHLDFNLGEIIKKFQELNGKSWKHTFGDGKASLRIVEDLLKRYSQGTFPGHQMEKYHPYSKRSFSAN